MSLFGLVVLILVLFFLFPRAGAYNANWGYAPFGIGGFLVILLIAWLLFGGGFHHF